MADAEAAGLSPDAYTNMTDPASIDAARHRIAVRIEALTGQTPSMGAPPPDASSAGGATTPGGASTTTSAAAPNNGNSNSATGGKSAASGGSGGGCSLTSAPTSTPASLALTLLALVAFAARRRVRHALARNRR